MSILPDISKVSYSVKVLPEVDKKELVTMYWRTKNLINLVLNADRQDAEARELRASATPEQILNFQSFLSQCEAVGIQYLERVLN